MSKELTPLEVFKSFLRTRGWYDEEFKEKYDFIVKILKAFEIIKEKDVNIRLLKLSSKLEVYNFTTYRKLTQEEYDLLKELLK